jgi:hypothetical protein
MKRGRYGLDDDRFDRLVDATCGREPHFPTIETSAHPLQIWVEKVRIVRV